MTETAVAESTTLDSNTPGMSGANPIKRKKSLPRLFILSRTKSKKGQSTTADADVVPTIPAEHQGRRPSATPSTKSSPRSPVPKETQSPWKPAKQQRFSSKLAQAEPECSPQDIADVGMSYTAGIACGPLSESDIQTPDSYNEEHSPGSDAQPHTSKGGVAASARDSSSMPFRLDPVPDRRSRGRASTTGAHKSLRPHTAIAAAFPEIPEDSDQYTPMHIGSARFGDEKIPSWRRSPLPDHFVSWNRSYTAGETQESPLSGLSTGSSRLDSSSTEFSSIFTKMSSISDMAYEVPEDDAESDGHSMTVDEAIDLYSAGFEDSDDESQLHTPDKEVVAHGRSLKLSQAMNDSIDTVLQKPVFRPDSVNSTTIMLGDALRSPFPRPPSIRRPDITHDEYGFSKVTRDISLKQYEAHHAEYSKIQSRRTEKWMAMMKSHGLSTVDPQRFPERTTKTQRFIRKGIPPAFRGNAWFFYAGGDELLHKNPDLYNQLVADSQTMKLTTEDREAIERDLNRTFPDNIHFKLDEPITPSYETPLLSSLRRVLHAFALHHPRIGYCQSLNFIAGLLLLFLPEEKAFWMLHIITTKYLPQTHDLSLEGANVDLWVLMNALKDNSPSIWAKVGGEVQTSTVRLPPISLCTTSWFMSMYIGTLPIESVLRVWDVLFYEGSRTLFRVALGIFKLGEAAIVNVSDPMEVFQVVQSLPRKMLDISLLMDVAFKSGGVSQQWVDKKRKERKDWYARERAVEKHRKSSRDMSISRRESGTTVGTEATRQPSTNLSLLSPTVEEPEPPATAGLKRSKSKAALWWQARRSKAVEAKVVEAN